MPNMFTLKSVNVDPDGVLDAHGLAPNGEVQKFIDSEVLRYCEPLVPFDQGTLQEAPRRGNYWFERAIHEEGGKDQILAGARKLAGAKQ